MPAITISIGVALTMGNARLLKKKIQVPPKTAKKVSVRPQGAQKTKQDSVNSTEHRSNSTKKDPAVGVIMGNKKVTVCSCRSMDLNRKDAVDVTPSNGYTKSVAVNGMRVWINRKGR